MRERKKMEDTDSPGLDSQHGSGDPLVDAARTQVAAARLRRESLVASGKMGALPPDAACAVPALTIPNYRLLRELHRGGQAVVYLALQQSTDREVAVKLFHHGAMNHPTVLARFEREVDVLTRLKHPHIVTIHDCGRAEENVYLVMDYVAGCSLDAHMAEQRPDLRDGLLLFAKICDAVHAAHLRGVIHRDLKPSNIRIDQDGEPRLLDFGLAKWAMHASDATAADVMTITGQFVGSLPWASPEQALGMSDTLDVRTDVYSLGVIFYQLLTGEFPYPVCGRMDDVIRHIASTDPARPSAFENRIGHEVETILLKSLAKEPERRYQSAGDLANDLRAYLVGEAIQAKRDSTTYFLRKQLRRHKWAVTAILGFMVLVAAGFSISATQWYRAEQALAREADQRQLADQRALETQKVADFQAKMLSDVNVDIMAKDIKERYRDQVRTALERQHVVDSAGRHKRTAQELEADMTAFDDLAGAAQTVDLARSVIDEHLLKPAAQSLRLEFTNQPLVESQIGAAIAKAYYALGLYAEAEPFLRQASDVYRRLLGSDDIRTIESISDLGLTLQAMGKPAEAEPLLREALDSRRRVLGDEHPDTLASLNNLGIVLYSRGDPIASATVLREALGIRRRVLGDEHRSTFNSMLNLTNSLRATGRLAEAVANGREALAVGRRALEPNDPYLASALANLGGLLDDQGDYKEAEAMLLESLALRREIFGDDHPKVASSLSNLGTLLHDMGDLDRAEAVTREALAVRRRLFGDEHLMVAQSLSNLGVLLKDKGEYVDSEGCLSEALALFRRLAGAEHPAVGQTLRRLGWLLHKNGDDAQAEAMLGEALVIQRKVLGERHPHVGLSLNDLGWILAEQGKCSEAEPLLREALDIVEKRYPVGHENVEKPRVKLAECLISHAGFAEAEPLLAKSSAALEASPDASSDLRAYLVQTYIKFYEAWEAVEPGKGYDAKASTWREKLAALGSPSAVVP